MKIYLLGKGPHARDKVYIDSMRTNVRFNVSCDGTGFSFIVSKEELREMIK